MLLCFWGLEAEKRKMKKTVKLFVMAVLLMAGGRVFAQDTHEYVDLGLPSGTLWATCNVGATTPEGYGDYFAWGETAPKDTYVGSNYKYYGSIDGYESRATVTKYCFRPYNGYNNYTDNQSVLLPEDDAATVNWGSDWRMPTWEEWFELIKNTTNKMTIQNGVKGWLFTAANGNSIFVPANGYRDSKLNNAGNYGNYWSSSVYGDKATSAYYFCFGSDTYIDTAPRNGGLSVRPVRANK